MKTVCEKDKCVGCMACLEVCSRNAICICDDIKSYNAVIDEENCINCGACFNVCQNNEDVSLIKPESWHQGWANDNLLRERASSGGLASEIIRSFITSGGKVCSCFFHDGEFIFGLESELGQIDKFSGSKYVKSNPKGIYKNIVSELKAGYKVLFLGLPCQVGALKKYIREDLQKQLYTVDLICHGTPSPQVLEKFLLQYNLSLKKLKDIQFRKKDSFQIFEQYRSIVMEGICDCYSITFLQSLCYTENCYCCKYARSERISDLTLGDSWGSELPIKEKKAGVSLVLCQTDKGKEILELADVHLEDVDIEKAIAHNGQLSHPSIYPEKRDVFLEGLARGNKFNKLVFHIFPQIYLRQVVKRILIKLKLWDICRR